MGDRLRVQEAVDGLVRGQSGRQGDESDDRQSRYVLGFPESVGETLRGRPAPQTEGHPERQGGQSIRSVVEGVAEKSNRTADHNHQGLDTGREKQDDERDGDRPNAVPAALERLIERVLGIVGVGRKEVTHQVAEATRVFVMVSTAVFMSVRVAL